ncbi:cytoplasmic dynein 2 intermediate chain 1-like [Pollicipes pollicipes]|uniref:cytoplasmic dynein 2 intermediate chain 1-like n=1 Tax=Pollicipes pollicipes TaxID=41117 RepID=UPI0018858F29|nr:cytoplasmic dynein 2 intermediate chain 1-like [Pollicipes pollicipes]
MRRKITRSGERPHDKPKPVRSVNFSSAKKHQQRKKSARKREGRGRALLSLIELFEQDFDLFELEPASYDQIMANFGKSGMQQGTSQTNEDDLTEELQTDEVKMRVKWTQHPIQFDVKVTTNNEGEVVSGPTYYDYMGVGGDMEEDEENMEDRRQSSAIRLNKFLGAAGSCMLMLLEEERARTAQPDSKSSAGHLNFTSASVRLGDGIKELLAGRSVSHLSFCDTDNKLLVTAHRARAAAGGDSAAAAAQKTADKPDEETAQKTDDEGSADAEEPVVDQYGLLCVWSVNEPSQPQKVLITSSQPVCCCFSPVKPRLAFAGCTDGSLDVWDLHEPASEHTGPRRPAAGAALRSPTYSTAEIHRAEAHTDPVVALRPTLRVGRAVWCVSAGVDLSDRLGR